MDVRQAAGAPSTNRTLCGSTLGPHASRLDSTLDLV